jgi:hypothetical protein
MATGDGACLRTFLLLNFQILGLVLTFGSSRPGAQAIAMTLLCMVFGFAHCIVSPMRESSAQTLQSALLFCLGE